MRRTTKRKEAIGKKEQGGTNTVLKTGLAREMKVRTTRRVRRRARRRKRRRSRRRMRRTVRRRMRRRIRMRGEGEEEKKKELYEKSAKEKRSTRR